MMHLSKNRPTQNKPHRNNQPIRDYEDEQDLIQQRAGDSNQLKEMKTKMKTMIGKLATSKKQKQIIQKQNEQLQKQVTDLQNNLRHMVVGFNNSTSQFPMTNELAVKIAEFYKYDCLDKFFDLLGPQQLTLKGIIYFYMQSFQAAVHLVEQHFQHVVESIKTTGCLDTVQGPIMTVLRKAFQTRHRNIIAVISKPKLLQAKACQIIDALGLNNADRNETISQIVGFLQKLTEIMLECKINDPPLYVDVGGIGKRIEYNSLIHDPFDGFIRNKQECFVILPQVRKQESELLTKGLVLHKNYDFSN